ncbi:unnamed protein product, partial [Ectocarpus fasciculatus]
SARRLANVSPHSTNTGTSAASAAALVGRVTTMSDIVVSTIFPIISRVVCWLALSARGAFERLLNWRRYLLPARYEIRARCDYTALGLPRRVLQVFLFLARRFHPVSRVENRSSVCVEGGARRVGDQRSARGIPVKQDLFLFSRFLARVLHFPHQQRGG